MPSVIRIPKIHAEPTRSFGKPALMLSAVLVMGNLSALVDHFLHPEIPYFDDEHLLVGGVNAAVTVLFIILLAIYFENLRRSRSEVLALNEALERKVEERTRQLHEAQEDLVQKEKLALLGLIAGGMGNELRNPLGVMNNAVFFLQSMMPDADETVREYLDIIRDEIDNSLRTISDLLDFYRTNNPQLKPTPVRELVELSLAGCAIPENVQLRIEIADLCSAVPIDPKQMERVLRNLITNAVQAMPDGGALLISARTPGAGLVPPHEREGQPRGSIPSEFLEISIADTGAGVAPEHIERLFQPLFTTKSRGLGLGLALSRKLAEANGGRIEMESEPGKGTCFTVKLPMDDRWKVAAGPAHPTGYHT